MGASPRNQEGIMSEKIKIPVYQPLLGEKEKKYVNDCLDTMWISSKGKYVPRFEKEFAEYIGCKYAAAVSNGTVALHLALLALGIGEGDEVIVPTLTYIASVNAIRYVGATPVFVDSDAKSWQMDPEDTRRKITDRTRAIMPVHLYGQPCDMDALMEIAKANDLFVVEDCAEAIGSEYKGKKVGTFGDISCFSFFGNKTITTGEGGMVLTDDKTLYDRAVHIKGQGLAQYREYWHDIVGYNYRMTNICAAIGCGQLEKVEEHIVMKEKIFAAYERMLSDLPVTLNKAVGDVRHTYWMVTILVNEAEIRDQLRDFLRNKGVETRPTFYPIHTMPMYSDKYQRHVTAENIAWRGMNLPSYPGLSEKDIGYICESIREFYMRKESSTFGHQTLLIS